MFLYDLVAVIPDSLYRSNGIAQPPHRQRERGGGFDSPGIGERRYRCNQLLPVFLEVNCSYT